MLKGCNSVGQTQTMPGEEAEFDPGVFAADPPAVFKLATYMPIRPATVEAYAAAVGSWCMAAFAESTPIGAPESDAKQTRYRDTGAALTSASMPNKGRARDMPDRM